MRYRKEEKRIVIVAIVIVAREEWGFGSGEVNQG